MEKHEALTQFANAIERVNFCNERIRLYDGMAEGVTENHLTPEQLADHRAGWVAKRSTDAERAVTALRELLA